MASWNKKICDTLSPQVMKRGACSKNACCVIRWGFIKLKRATHFTGDRTSGKKTATCRWVRLPAPRFESSNFNTQLKSSTVGYISTILTALRHANFISTHWLTVLSTTNIFWSRVTREPKLTFPAVHSEHAVFNSRARSCLSWLILVVVFLTSSNLSQ